MMKISAHILAKQLAKTTLSTTEEALLELSISRFINMLNTSMQDTVPIKNSSHNISGPVSTTSYRHRIWSYDGSSPELSALFDAIVHVGDNIWDVIAFIDEKMANIKNKMPTTKFATILEFVFDCTDVAVVDGENSCEATKNVALLNKAIFTPMQAVPVFGKKINENGQEFKKT
ncbi:hypothetical protein BDB00DRAFT_930910 [Zychaea mexicana]|uniref:uncharacterized protein n=1 Tax=Zychaea mexicana TaxID=64656 RepID=UPI0022FE36D3|nr:uncharacterized protein BDB00DRAFT_930910 [Zychaea mexicana]KAI9490759.1 hypothetical protein BDB00DRAFT_930910 [Zychaea mexicana]